VRPEQIAAVLAAHPQIGKARLVVTREGESDAMTLQCEVQSGDEALAQEVGASLQTILKLRGKVAFTAPGSLPNDGKVIADERSYD